MMSLCIRTFRAIDRTAFFEAIQESAARADNEACVRL
jgi:hypothetical protein